MRMCCMSAFTSLTLCDLILDSCIWMHASLSHIGIYGCKIVANCDGRI
uniref:Uncharacterized protein n=1 Tax=Arundo donax TaxID=35708 RepID=A0A0A8Z9F6_ARUDO